MRLKQGLLGLFMAGISSLSLASIAGSRFIPPRPLTVMAKTYEPPRVYSEQAVLSLLGVPVTVSTGRLLLDDEDYLVHLGTIRYGLGMRPVPIYSGREIKVSRAVYDSLSVGQSVYPALLSELQDDDLVLPPWAF